MALVSLLNLFAQSFTLLGIQLYVGLAVFCG